MCKCSLDKIAKLVQIEESHRFSQRTDKFILVCAKNAKLEDDMKKEGI